MRLQVISGDANGVQRVVSALESYAAVAILFSGPGCRACGAVKSGLRPDLLRNGIVFDADVNRNADLADAYSISATPTMVLLSPSQELGRVRSATPDEFNALLRTTV
jgi:hypothetical protein